MENDELSLLSSTTTYHSKVAPYHAEAPNHYSRLNPQPVEVIEAWGLDFHRGNALKYLARAEHKGEAIRDLKKAIWYLNRRIQVLEHPENPPVPEEQV